MHIYEILMSNRRNFCPDDFLRSSQTNIIFSIKVKITQVSSFFQINKKFNKKECKLSYRYPSLYASFQYNYINVNADSVVFKVTKK